MYSLSTKIERFIDIKVDIFYIVNEYYATGLFQINLISGSYYMSVDIGKILTA